MLRLAKLGSVIVNAHNDYLSLESEGSVDLSSRTRWPIDALTHHDGLRTAIEVEQCLEAGFAESNEGQIVIRHDLFPAIRRAGQGIKNIHNHSRIPIKKTKKKSLRKEQKKFNKRLAKERIVVEHVHRRLKIFRILSSRYRNRRRRFGLRINLIAGIYNYEMYLSSQQAIA